MATQFYQYNTFAQAKQAVADRLYDSGMVFYTDAEIGLYVIEALRTFNAYAQYWRSDFVFPAVQGTQWYDLTQVPNTLRPYTVTDQNLYTVMEYQLLEPVSGNFPATGTVWTGTDMFSASDLVNAVQRRRDEVLSVTGCSVSRSTVSAVVNTTRTLLSESTIDVRRLAYFPVCSVASVAITNPGLGQANGMYTINASGGGGTGAQVQITIASGIILLAVVVNTGANYTSPPTFTVPATTGLTGVLTATLSGMPNVLYPEDVWSFQSFEPGWTTQAPGTPFSYAMSSQPPVSFDVDVPPGVAGNFEVLTVNAGPVLTVNAATLLGIPDDFAWVLKWGALADLFSKQAEAKDELRAEYCNKRYQQGMALLMAAPAVLALRVNNNPVWTDAVRAADEYNTFWQGAPQGTPGQAYVGGLNLIALSPAPDVGPYSVTATVVQNAPVPVMDTDYIQVGQDDYDVLIDYCEHIAMLKNGGAEFVGTSDLYSRFVRQASRYNSKLEELGEFKQEMYGLSQRQEMMAPRYAGAENESGEEQ